MIYVFQSCSLKSLRLAFSCYPSIQSVYLGCRSIGGPEEPGVLPWLLSKLCPSSNAAQSLFAGWVCCPMSSRHAEPQLPSCTASTPTLMALGGSLTRQHPQSAGVGSGLLQKASVSVKDGKYQSGDATCCPATVQEALSSL